MNRNDTLSIILQEKAVAIIRLDQPDAVQPVAAALADGGIKVLEITMGTPGVLKHITALIKQRPELTIGAGSVLDETTARLAILSGAQFLVTPVMKTGIIQTAHRYDIPVLIGAFSPTEILAAYEAGADMVKIFPAEVLGIPFIRAVKAPMPQLRLMPTGGVTVDNAAEWIAAGASALGVGSALVDKKLVAQQNFSQITENARQMVENLKG